MKLSIIIPVYNEEKTILEILRRIKAVVLPGGLTREIIMIDDCSRDGSRQILESINDPEVKVFFKDTNGGKGSAVRRGLLEATGDILLIQDADLEYNPEEYPKLLEPILAGRADAVFGSRFMGSEAKRVLFFWHYLANRFLTTFSNALSNLNLTDMETCYKVFTKDAADSFKHQLTANRFGIEPELTARLAKGHWRIYEIGISYDGRTYEEGKKINWRDGVAALWFILKFNLFSRKK
jgi:glycosyltransferase involved in cell wall biosynthesis